jgi:hypothetical protein
MGVPALTADELATMVATEAAGELSSAFSRIQHCTDQLTDAQIWWRPDDQMNSIGNLILHLTGNVRQWLLSGLGGSPEPRNRPAEFAERGPIPKDDLLRALESTLAEATAILRRLTAQSLLAPRVIQGFDVTGLQAIFNSVPHFRGHTQEIIHMTRLQLGNQYRIAWEPATAEEGAPSCSSDLPNLTRISPQEG